MIKSRREIYLKQVAAMAVLAGSGGNGSTTSGSGQAASLGTALGGMTMTRILETALIIALVVEAGIATYIYRDRIADFINSTLFPNVEQIGSPPGGSSSELLSGEQAYTSTPAGTASVTVSETPSPAISFPTVSGNGDGTNNDGGETGEIQITSTPTPNVNPGLHLGQTKQPTQDSGEDKQNNSDLNGNDQSNDQKNKRKSD